MRYDYWGLGIFGFLLFTSMFLSILSVRNGTSGHWSILQLMLSDQNFGIGFPILIAFPIIIFIFCMAFSMLITRLADQPEARSTALYSFVGVTYILSVLCLHLSTYIINLSYK
jgi:uncharacterized membrane protein YhaH (DUF805 family)